MEPPLPHGHGVGDEPHLRGEAERDPSEEVADALLRREAARPDPVGHEVQQSVYEEVHPLWSVRDSDGERWGDWYLRMRSSVTVGRSWAATLVVALVSGPFAVLGAFLETRDSALAAVVFAPTVEEVVKIGVLAILVETRPYLVSSALQIRVVALLSALAFATLENLLYLRVYVPDPSAELTLWRWTVCTALHLTATGLAAQGLVGAWRRTQTELRRPSLDRAFGWLVAAILVHAAYNLAVTLFPPF